MGRRRVAGVVIAFVVIASALGWFAGSRVRSQAEVAAATAAPTATPILVPAEMRSLQSTIVTRGTARFGSPTPVTLGVSSLKAEAGLATNLPDVGAVVQEGQSVMASSGRPVLVLAGAVPSHRDLAPGATGDDVAQLEEALARLGHDPGAVDGTFDTATAAAVARWYRSEGWEPFGTTAEQTDAIRAVELELTQAQGERLSASDAVATARSEAVVAEAARSAAADAAGAADSTVRTAEAEARAADAAAAAEVMTRSEALAAVVAEPGASRSALDAARAELFAAKLSQEAVRLAGVDAVAQARHDGAAAVGELFAAEAELQRARTALSLAVSQQFNLDAPVASARRDLDAARAASGIQVPTDEIVFLPELPIRVDQVDIGLGDSASGTVMTVTDSRLSVDSSLTLEEAALVTPGTPVVIEEAALGLAATGTVELVAEAAGTRGVDGFHRFVEVATADAPASIVGTSVRLTIAVEATEAEVLAVPVNALSLAADGSSRVQVERDGTLEFLTVEPGLSAQGYVELTAVEGDLAAGDPVVVGNDPRMITQPAARRGTDDSSDTGDTERAEVSVLDLVGVGRRFGTDPPIDALVDVDLHVERGEWVAVVGPSGSGKSTLLNVLGCLDRHTAGTYGFEGVDVGGLSDTQRAGLRSERIGFVFQGFHLLNHRPVVENVMMAELYRPDTARGRRDRALEVLESVGLSHRADFLPNRLSGGERQRVAVARALLGRPSLLLCDEPTGNLDSHMTQAMLALFAEVHRSGLTLVVITHEPDVADAADRSVRIVDGTIVERT